MNTFAELLDEYMNKAGWADEALADQIGVSKMTVYNWRNGKVQRPVRDKVLKCAEVLKLMPKQRAELLLAAGHLPETNQPLQAAVPVVGVPIVQPYQFFGRENVLSQIGRVWRKPVLESIVIIGSMRSGKTSLLNYLNKVVQATYLRSDQPKGWPEDWVPRNFRMALIDFQEANMCEAETLMSDVLQQLQLKVPQPCNLANFASVIKQRVNQPTVILMDELEIGLTAPGLDAAFWRNLRALGNNGQLSFVVTASEPLTKLAREFGEVMPFFRLFGHTLHLEALTEEEARELLAHSPQPLSAQEVEEMLDESGCWPEPLQMLCDERL